MHAICVYCGSPWCTCFDTDEEYEEMRDENDTIESGGASLKIDDETGKPYWSLWGADWKGGEDMDPGERINLSPDAYPPGTRVVIIEPGPDSKVAQEFYRRFGNKPAPTGAGQGGRL